MTVGELIKDLSEYPEDMPVRIALVNGNAGIALEVDSIGTSGQYKNGLYKPEKVIIELTKDPEDLREEMEECFRLADEAIEDMKLYMKEIMKDI